MMQHILFKQVNEWVSRLTHGRTAFMMFASQRRRPVTMPTDRPRYLMALPDIPRDVVTAFVYCFTKADE